MRVQSWSVLVTDMFNANVLMSRKQAHAMDIQRFYSPPVNNSRVQSFGKTAAVAYAPDSMVNIIDMRSRRRRVWKACERCRTKKIKVYMTAKRS